MTMNVQIMKEARKLAKNYILNQTSEWETEDGHHMWLAEDLDLVGCMAQGITEEEACNNLLDSRIDFIYFLLEDDMELPRPTTYEDLWKAYDKENNIK